MNFEKIVEATNSYLYLHFKHLYLSELNFNWPPIDEIKSVPHVPWSHPFIERIIGTVRRDYLDQIFFWGEADLERKLKEYVMNSSVTIQSFK